MTQIITKVEENDILEKLRKDFFNDYKANIENDCYDIRDLNRLKESNRWLYTFYRHVHKRYDAALALIPDVLKWRKEYNANDFLNENDLPFPEDLLKKGSMFFRNYDKNGIPLLHFAVRTHKKDQYAFDHVCKFISYHFEKYYKFDWNYQIILCFDMSDAGLANLDMEMIKFVVTCLKVYYPGLINYMLIFQMPFLFNAAWRIIKNWLPPEAIQLIKFVDKKSIKEYIDDSSLFTHMGGSDTYTYKYDPNNYKSSVKELDESIKKRVSFASLDAVQPSANTNGSIVVIHKSQSEIIEHKNFTDGEEMINPSEINVSKRVNILSINPSNEIIFHINDSKPDYFQNITLHNNSIMYLAYKIKITSPDKYRVKPGVGVIDPMSSAQIIINFLKQHHSSSNHHRDKFLILWTTVETKPTDLIDLWKNQSKSQIHEHKLKCVIVNHIEEVKYKNEQSSSPVNESLSTKHNDSFFASSTEINNSSNVSGLNLTLKNELKELKGQLNDISRLQMKFDKKYKFLLFLVYFLIFLNLIQLLVQSNFYNYLVEPYIDQYVDRIFLNRD